MRRAFRTLLAAFLALGLLAGCEAEKPLAFTAENEIATYEQADPSQTQLSVSSLGNNANISKLSAAFEAQNPDVQVICMDLTGGTAAYRSAVDWVVHGKSPDVMLMNPDTLIDDDQIIEYFEDLSASPVIANFKAEALSRITVKGFVYFLPAPSEINCIIYNKTLFEQYGWQVPATFDEFVALCLRIREDTGGAVQPWNPNAKYDNVFSTAVEAFAYAQLFGGVENRNWYNDFCEGKVGFAGHMEPFYAMLQTLIDNDILLEEHFTYSATARGKEFEAGQIAMYNAPISRMNSKTYTFGYMPYPATEGETGYVNDAFSAVLCVPKKERSDAQRDALERFLAFYASTEGQQALIGDTLMVSNVEGVPINESEALSEIEAVIDQGHVFNRLDFPGSGELNWAFREAAQDKAGGQASVRSWTFRAGALSMVKGEKTGAQIIAEIDEKPYLTPEESGVAGAVKLAEVTEDFTIWEFSSYIADAYREKAGADIGLINHNIAYRGNLVRLFAGGMYDSYLYPIKPRSFANGSTLVKASMTGRQLLDALNHPVGYDCVSNSVYAYSGLRYEIAPWNELGEKYRSVKLADGSPLEEDKRYTVAFWEGSVAEEYVTEVLERYEGTWEALMAAKFAADEKIAPAKDGRVKLVWPQR